MQISVKTAMGLVLCIGVAICAAGLRPWHPAARMASLCPEIIT